MILFSPPFYSEGVPMNTMQIHGTGVLDMIRSLSEFDILAIQQYSDQQTQ